MISIKKIIKDEIISRFEFFIFFEKIKIKINPIIQKDKLKNLL